MILTLVLVAPAVLLAIARGGSVRRLAETELKGLPLIFGGLAVQLGLLLMVDADDVPEWAAGLTLVAASAAVAGALLLNRRLAGARVAFVGVVLNMLVIGANGGMPISVEAAETAGIREPLDELDVEHEQLRSDTRLRWLADVIPFPGSRMVVSVGDVLLAAGIARLVYSQTLHRDQGLPTPPGGK